jgi:hypothetical protein
MLKERKVWMTIRGIERPPYVAAAESAIISTLLKNEGHIKFTNTEEILRALAALEKDGHLSKTEYQKGNAWANQWMTNPASDKYFAMQYFWPKAVDAFGLGKLIAIIAAVIVISGATISFFSPNTPLSNFIEKVVLHSDEPAIVSIPTTTNVSTTTEIVNSPIIRAANSNVAVGNTAPVSQTIRAYPKARLESATSSDSVLQSDNFYHTSYKLTLWYIPGTLENKTFFASSTVFTYCLEPKAAGLRLQPMYADLVDIECLSKNPPPEKGVLFVLTNPN